MIASLSGTIIEIDSKFIILEVNNIGYKIFVTNDVLHTLKQGSQSKFHTHLAVREDAMDLYGFLTQKEKTMFELLITVSGIGPRGALNVLSSVSIEALINAVNSGSTSHLIKISGIGRKTAEKIVLELKDKLGLLTDENNTVGLSSDADAIEALKMLGYGPDEAREALKKVDRNIQDTGEKVKFALKILN